MSSIYYQSDSLKEAHKAVIHMVLHMAVKQTQPRLIGNKINLNVPIWLDTNCVLDYS